MHISRMPTTLARSEWSACAPGTISEAIARRVSAAPDSHAFELDLVVAMVVSWSLNYLLCAE